MPRTPFSLPAFLALFAPTLPLSAEQVNDPFPEKIAKSDVTVELETVAEGLVSPVLVVQSPDSRDRLFIVDQVGVVRTVEKGKLLPEPLLDVRDRLVKLNKDFDERGLLGLAFDPEYLKAGSNGHRRIVAFWSEPNGQKADFPIVHGKSAPDCQNVVGTWKVKEDGLSVDPTSLKDLMRIDKPQFNHN